MDTAAWRVNALVAGSAPGPDDDELRQLLAVAPAVNSRPSDPNRALSVPAGI
jgi:hypothetical protein